MQSAPQNKIIIATANTHWTTMLSYHDGLEPVASADILVLQEVILAQRDCEARLKQAGFELIHISNRFGLAIATRVGSRIALVPGSIKEHRLQRMGVIERYLMQKGAKRSHQFTEHGVLAAKFRINNNQTITVATVHLSMPLKLLARTAQVHAMSQEFTNAYYHGPLIVAGDMNHYRGPGNADKSMHADANLRPIDLNGESTWSARGSRQEKYLKTAALFRKHPLEHYDGYHDVVLHREEGLRLLSLRVVDTKSDHKAIIAQFMLEVVP